VVIARFQDDAVVHFNVDKAMFVCDAPRPGSCEGVLERLGLANAAERLFQALQQPPCIGWRAKKMRRLLERVVLIAGHEHGVR
jgi:hypothetical protein